jgi:hypothetical protein
MHSGWSRTLDGFWKHCRWRREFTRLTIPQMLHPAYFSNHRMNNEVIQRINVEGNKVIAALARGFIDHSAWDPPLGFHAGY